MEIRNVSRAPKIEQRADGKRTLKGYGATFYDGTPATEFELVPGVFERIARGAFANVLNADVRILHDHDTGRLLGRTAAGTAKIGVDSVGLWYSVVLGDSTIARDVADAVQRGDLSGASIGFNIGRQRRFSEGGKEIIEIQTVSMLAEISLVAFPAYQSTSAELRARQNESRTERLIRLSAEACATERTERLRAECREALRPRDIHPPVIRRAAPTPPVDPLARRPGESRADWIERERRSVRLQLWVSENLTRR